MDDNWLIGFIEGEGNFTIGMYRSKTHKSGFAVAPMFVIGLDLKDKLLLEKIKEKLGFGSIYIQRKTHSFQYVIKNKRDVHNLILWLENKSWYGHKKKNFDLFKEAFYIKYPNKKTLKLDKSFDFDRIKEIRLEMNRKKNFKAKNFIY